MIKMVLIKAGEAKRIEMKKAPGYKEIKKLLGIESPVDVQERKIGGKLYDVWLDDEGLLHGEKHSISGITTFSGSGKVCEFMVGNLLIANHDEEGNVSSLSDDDVKNVLGKVNIMAFDCDTEIDYACGTKLSLPEAGKCFLEMEV